MERKHPRGGDSLVSCLLHFTSSMDQFFPGCSVVTGLLHLMLFSITVLQCHEIVWQQAPRADRWADKAGQMEPAGARTQPGRWDQAG